MAQNSEQSSFYTSLGCGALGIQPGFDAAVELAAEFGYGGVDPDPGYLRQLDDSGLVALRNRLDGLGLGWGSAGVPVDLTGDAATFARQLSGLGEYAELLQAAGVNRAGTWIRPMSDSVTYRRNFAKHVERVGLVGEILGAAGVRFGLEYVGPKTFWSTERFPFVHTLGELRQLLDAVGDDNVGVVLDSFHWYTSHESVDDLLALTGHQVVAVDVNDARVGLEPDEQLDGKRMLPGATGVIDLPGFVGALRTIGYDGPVKVEPFNAELSAQPVRDVVSQTADALKSVVN